MTVGSDETEASSELSHRAKLAWTPPANWSGPSANSTRDGDSVFGIKKPINPLRRVKSSSKFVASATTKLLHSYPDVPRSVTPAHSVATTLGDDEPPPPMRWKRNSHRVIVKMQDFPGDDLKEAPLQDVISRLRVLKSSAV